MQMKVINTIGNCKETVTKVINSIKSPSKFTNIETNDVANRLIFTTNNEHQSDPHFLL